MDDSSKSYLSIPYNLDTPLKWKKEFLSCCLQTEPWLREQGCKTKTNKKICKSCRETTDRVLKKPFAYLKLAALKMDKYAINLKWCLTRRWSSWQPDYFTKLTASYPTLSWSKYTYQDGKIQRRRGPTHSHTITFCSMLLSLLIPPWLYHHTPLPSQTLIHIL